MVAAKDIKVNQQGWKFSDRNPEPPLANVMASGFWSSAHYEPLRQRLARPLLEVKLKPGGDFLTLSTQGEGKTAEAMLTQSEEATQVHLPLMLLSSQVPSVSDGPHAVPVFICV